MRTRVTYRLLTGSMLFLCVGGIAAISLTWLPANGQDAITTAPPLEMRSGIEPDNAIALALANSLVKIRTAERIIAEVQKELATERKKLLLAQVRTAQVLVKTTNDEEMRLSRLPQTEKKLPEMQEKLRATQAALAAAKQLLEEAKAKESIGEVEISLETAKLELAKAVLEEVIERRKPLLPRAEASKAP